MLSKDAEGHLTARVCSCGSRAKNHCAFPFGSVRLSLTCATSSGKLENAAVALGLLWPLVALQLQQCMAWHGCFVPMLSGEKGTLGSCFCGDRVRLLLIPRRNKTSLHQSTLFALYLHVMPKCLLYTLFVINIAIIKESHTPMESMKYSSP